MYKHYAVVLALCLGSSAAGASPATTPRIVAAAEKFLATLEAPERATVLFERTDTAQKQRRQDCRMDAGLTAVPQGHRDSSGSGENCDQDGFAAHAS